MKVDSWVMGGGGKKKKESMKDVAARKI